MMRRLFAFLTVGCWTVAAYYLVNDDFRTAWPVLGLGMIPAVGVWRMWGFGKDAEKINGINVSELEESQREFALEQFDKAVMDYNAVEDLRKEIQDADLEQQLAKMQAIAYRLLKYLEEHPVKVTAANRFVDYYQDRAVQLARQYRDLEQTGLDTQQVKDTKRKVKETLDSFDKAYAAEFEKVLSQQLMDMDAELKVLHQSIEEDGLRDAGLSQRADELSMMDRARQEANEKSRQGTLTVVNSGPPVNMGGRGLELRNRKGTDAIREVAERYAHVPAERKGAVLRDKAINSLLAVFLGTFGAHKFFQGKTYSGILYAVFFWTFLPTFIGFVEGIRYAVMPLDDYYKQYFRD